MYGVFLCFTDIAFTAIIIILILIMQSLYSTMKPKDTEALGGARPREFLMGEFLGVA